MKIYKYLSYCCNAPVKSKWPKGYSSFHIGGHKEHYCSQCKEILELFECEENIEYEN